METRREKRDLYVPLTLEERDEFTTTLVDNNEKLTEIEEQKKTAVDGFNADKKEVETEMADLYRKLRRNEKLTEVEVEVSLNVETGMVETKRTDTNEVIDERARKLDDLFVAGEGEESDDEWADTIGTHETKGSKVDESKLEEGATEDVDEIFDFQHEGVNLRIGVGFSQVPLKYKATSFNVETGEVTFYTNKKMTNKIAVVQGRILPLSETEVEE
jgi:hypothetical protein